MNDYTLVLYKGSIPDAKKRLPKSIDLNYTHFIKEGTRENIRGNYYKEVIILDEVSEELIKWAYYHKRDKFPNSNKVILSGLLDGSEGGEV